MDEPFGGVGWSAVAQVLTHLPQKMHKSNEALTCLLHLRTYGDDGGPQMRAGAVTDNPLVKNVLSFHCIQSQS